MGKSFDITDKLNFEEKPKLVIKDVEIEVDNSAMAMLKIMNIFSEKEENEAISDAIGIMFDEKNRKKLEGLKLNFKDFMTVIEAAMDIIKGEGEEDSQGEL